MNQNAMLGLVWSDMAKGGKVEEAEQVVMVRREGMPGGGGRSAG